MKPARAGRTRAGRRDMPGDDQPIGGTTGLCHQSSEAIGNAAAWYAANRETCERPIVPALRRRFGLTAAEACAALSEAGRIG